MKRTDIGTAPYPVDDKPQLQGFAYQQDKGPEIITGIKSVDEDPYKRDIPERFNAVPYPEHITEQKERSTDIQREKIEAPFISEEMNHERQGDEKPDKKNIGDIKAEPRAPLFLKCEPFH